MLGLHGRLSHFDGRQWTDSQAALPGSAASDDDDDDFYPPGLAVTDDGTVWLVRNGLWRCSGAEVPAAVAEAIRHTNARSAPDLCTSYRRLGLAMRALDRKAEAEEHLQKAIANGPRGRWALAARADRAQGRLSGASR